MEKGCFFDLKQEDQVACTKDDNCKQCDGEKCNTDEAVTTLRPADTPKPSDTPKPEDTPKPDETTKAPEPTKEPTKEEFECNICRSDKVDQKACAFELKDTTFQKRCELTPKTDAEKACYVERLRE